MKKVLISSFLLILALFYFNGCLSVEKKEYKITLTGKTTGKAVVKYINIRSQKEEEKDVSMKDFASLITDYLEGNKPDDEFPGVKNMKKRIYEENNTLCASFEFEFDSLETVKLFKYNDDAPYMVIFKESFPNEQYLESNGDYGKNGFSIAIWDKKQKEFKWATTVSSDTANMVSLINHYKNWEKNK